MRLTRDVRLRYDEVIHQRHDVIRHIRVREERLAVLFHRRNISAYAIGYNERLLPGDAGAAHAAVVKRDDEVALGRKPLGQAAGGTVRGLGCAVTLDQHDHVVLGPRPGGLLQRRAPRAC